MKTLAPKVGRKRIAALAHDLVMTALALVICYFARFGLSAVPHRLDEMALLIAITLPAAAVIYHRFGMYAAVWRFASAPDLVAILKAVTALTCLLALVDFTTRGGIVVPRSVVFLFWFVAGALLAGPRLIFRSYRDRHLIKYAREADTIRVPALILGTGRSAEVLIRSLETDPRATLRPQGLLALKSRHVGQRIRGVPVLGTDDDLASVVRQVQARSDGPLRLIVTDESFLDQERLEAVVAEARSLGMTVERLTSRPQSHDGPSQLRFNPIDIADLHRKAPADKGALRAMVAGRRVAVTGAGVIGSEICRQVAEAGCSSLLVMDEAELAVYNCQRNLAASFPELPLKVSLVDVRQARAVEELFQKFKPDAVFHTASIKNEAVVARQLPTALSVNLGGTIAVADAAIASGASSFVLLSTDQAAGPTSTMGATKRLAELYLELIGSIPFQAPGVSSKILTRFVAVRFANIYSASGATIAGIRSQITRGGPVVVGARESGIAMPLDQAVAEVLRSAADVVSIHDRPAAIQVRLGEPMLLEMVARRMIRLFGLEPEIDVELVVRGAADNPKAAEELQARVPALVQKAGRDPTLCLREILAFARPETPAEETLARLAQLSTRPAGDERLH